ncbi:MAG: PrsW family intramembrane metalloprotease [Chlorobi bacterium]|nr:PrsW family intramembrane metalloprotease [Chlorobiota bacterium]
MILIAVALAPVIVLLMYINYRDKYEKEPRRLLAKAFIFGIISVIPVYFIETGLTNYWHTKYALPNMPLKTAAFDAFAVAAFTEEFFKILVFFILIWKNKNFNEKFDGIIYAVFISMGFAATENLMYVLSSGFTTGLIRAFTAVPAHAIFAVSSGYFLAFAKFKPSGKFLYLILALLVPVLLHGIYDFILLSKNDLLLLIFAPYVIFILIIALKGIKRHSNASRFKPNIE